MTLIFFAKGIVIIIQCMPCSKIYFSCTTWNILQNWKRICYTLFQENISAWLKLAWIGVHFPVDSEERGRVDINYFQNEEMNLRRTFQHCLILFMQSLVVGYRRDVIIFSCLPLKWGDEFKEKFKFIANRFE